MYDLRNQFRIIHDPECSVSYCNLPSIYHLVEGGEVGGCKELDSTGGIMEVLTSDVNGIHKSLTYSLFLHLSGPTSQKSLC